MGLTRTSSLRPLRILAKIPSLRQRRSKVKKRPEFNVHRATCSSTLKSSKVPDHIELHSREGESEGISSYHVCPYSYCSLHGQHHHVPSPPIKEFISTKRQLLHNKKGKQMEDQSSEVVYSTSVAKPEEKYMPDATIENDHEEEDDGVDFLIKIYAKPRKKWVIGDAEGLKGSVHNQINVRDHDWKLTEILYETSKPEARQKRLSDGQPESYKMFSLDDIIQQKISEIAASNSISELPDASPKSESIDERLEEFTSKESGNFKNRDSEVSSGVNLIDILSDRQKYTSLWHLIYKQLVPSETSMADNPGVNGVDEKEKGDEETKTRQEMNDLDLKESENNTLNEEDDQAVAMEKVEFDQNAAIKMVQEALSAILQHEEQSPTSIPMDSLEESFRESGEVAVEDISSEKEDEVHKLRQISAISWQKSGTDEEMTSGKNMSNSYRKLRKVFVTAKLIKAMERMRKISPRKPHLLDSESTTDEERVYLRHFSMKGRKNEGWMLDYALRKVISRLGPDEQRRVTLLVNAFETVNPEQKEKGIRCYPVKRRTDHSLDSTNHMNEEPICFSESEKSISEEQVPVQMHDGEVSVPLLCVPEERSMSEAAGSDAPSERVLQACDETDSSNCTSKSSENKPRSASIDATLEEPNKGNEETMTTLEVQPQLSTSSDTTAFIFDEQKYQSMWSLIYQHVLLSETSMDSEKEVNELDEKKKGGQDMKDSDSTQSSNNTRHDEDENNQSAAVEKHEFNQSAAIKLVKEAVNAILQRYEESSDERIPSYQDRAIGDDGKYVVSASIHSVEGGESVVKHTPLEINAKLNQTEKSEELYQQVEPTESKTPQKKFSKSYNKMKKAFLTAKFINAIERLRKITPQKPQHLNQEAASEEERVHLRHLSMNGRKNEEEWMLDYALRQVISKLDPDQQRRVGRLVEAFETVTPDQKDTSIRLYPSKGEFSPGIGLADPTKQAPRQFVATLRGRSKFDEVPGNQDDGVLLSHIGTRERRALQDGNDNQDRIADDTTEQEADKATVSYSTLEFSEDNRISNQHEIAMSKVEVSSPIEGDSEISIAGDMLNILSDKHKYNSMWHLIYHHAVSSEASFAGKEVASGVDDDEQSDDASTCQKTNHLDSHQSRNQMKDINNESEKYEKQELDQSAAIKLVKEAINAILQGHGQISNKKSHQDQDRDVSASKEGEICNTSAPVSTEKDSRAGQRVEMHRSSEPENKKHVIEKANATLLEQAQSIEVKSSQQSNSKSNSRLRKLIMTTKFINAMERLRRTSPRKWSPETTSEEERIKLRHQNTNQKKSAEEWMLDFALRKVISNLAPDQQKKVAQLAEAFEAVTPEQKDSGIISRMKPATSTTNDEKNVELEHEDSTSFKALITPKHEDQLNPPGKVVLLERGLQEDHHIEISNFRTELKDKVLGSDGINFPIHHQVNPEVRRKEETDSNSMAESLQQAYSSKETRQESDAKRTNGLFSDSRKHTTMWHLIYQHLEPTNAEETESKQGERVANEEHMTPRSTLSQTIVDADTDDSDASSVASEFTESDAVKLVKEAINNILDRPQELDDELLTSNIMHAPEEDQRAAGEMPEKSLTRAYSKLRKLIICNKFIKAMEKTRKSYPQKHKKLELDSDGESEKKAHLKHSMVGEKISADAWMLDNALQKAITGLAPVQRRRVSMLIEAFEKVNPDLEEINNRSRGVRSKSADSVVSADDAKNNKDSIFESSQKLSDLEDGCDIEFKQSLVTSSNTEASKGKVEVEINEERTPSSGDAHALSGGDRRNDDPYRTKTAISDVMRTKSDVGKNIEEMAHARDLVEERSPIRENLAEYSRSNTDFTAMLSQPEDVKHVWKGSTKIKISSDRETSANLWCLLVKHINSDVSEEVENQKSFETDANANIDSANILLKKNNDNHLLISPEVNDDKNMEAQTPKSMSFEFQEQEAIKLVQEALHEILLPEDLDKTLDDQSIETSAISDQAVCNEKHGDGGEFLAAATEFSVVETLHDTASTPQEDNVAAKENLGSSSNKLSKVILCKRFINAMDKMRKLKQQSPTHHVEQLHSQAESKRSVRQIVSSDKKSWEEGMLDQAMQKVVAKLAPAQKKKVALLVQAFETVGSQPEPSTK